MIYTSTHQTKTIAEWEWAPISFVTVVQQKSHIWVVIATELLNWWSGDRLYYKNIDLMLQICIIIIIYINITLKLYKNTLQFSAKFVLWNVIEHDGTLNKYIL